MTELLWFPGRKGAINILEKIGSKYSQLGIFLLDDDTGVQVDAIAKEHNKRAEDINFDILKKWLQGGGMQPVTWGTLVDVLGRIGHNILADDIRSVKGSGQ